jgi:hypothetical protein
MRKKSRFLLVTAMTAIGVVAAYLLFNDKKEPSFNDDECPGPPIESCGAEEGEISEIMAMEEADLRRAEELYAMGCDDADVNGWPARLHVALNVDEP